jgi:hypothetical protein
MASLMEFIGKGKVIGVDIDIRARGALWYLCHDLRHGLGLRRGAGSA